MRLIDADKLTELCDIMADKCDGIGEDGIGESVWHQFRTTVEWSPTIDAVPVIRCKDCKRRYIKNDVWTCPFGLMSGPDGYCSYAERKEE